MRNYGKVSPRFWTGDSGRALRGKPNVQLVALYLITAPGANMIGLFYLPLVIISHETGLSQTEVLAALDTLSRMGVAHYDQHQEIVFVPEMAKHQVDEQLKPGDNRRKGIAKDLQPFLRHPFAKTFITRYWAAFSLSGLEGLPDPGEAPLEGLPRGSTATPEAPSKPGSGSGAGSGTGAGEEPLPHSDEKPTGPDREEPAGPPQLPAGQVNGHGLARMFGIVRAREVQGTLPWSVPRDTTNKGDAIADAIREDSAARADVIPSMVLFFKRAKAGEIGQGGKAVSDPAYGFACWVSGFTALREALSGKGPSVAAAARAQQPGPFYRPFTPIPPGVPPPPRPRP